MCISMFVPDMSTNALSKPYCHYFILYGIRQFTLFCCFQIIGNLLGNSLPNPNNGSENTRNNKNEQMKPIHQAPTHRGSSGDKPVLKKKQYSESIIT